MRGVFRAIWPIVNADAAGPNNKALAEAALEDLPNVARRHGVVLDGGERRAYVTDAHRIPGSGGQGLVLVIECPGHKAPARSYHRAGGAA